MESPLRRIHRIELRSQGWVERVDRHAQPDAPLVLREHAVGAQHLDRAVVIGLGGGYRLRGQNQSVMRGNRFGEGDAHKTAKYKSEPIASD